jgi:hypothetical protein
MKNPMLLMAFTALFILCAQTASSQYYYYNNNYYDKDVIWEVGFSVGGMNGLTDIGSKKSPVPVLKTTQLNGSFYVGALYMNMLGLRVEFTKGRIAGADSLGAYPQRNLSYRTSISEIAVIGEFHPLMLKYYDEAPMFSPYLTGGIGWVSFNPQANLDGRWIDLQPLRTEGQGFPEAKSLGSADPYKTSVASMIGGLGVKYDLNPLICFRAELLYHRTFTDYLDDAGGPYIDPAWFDNNLNATQAALAKRLYDRTGEKYTATNAIGNPRGSVKSKDAFLNWNVKVAINLGRQQVR